MKPDQEMRADMEEPDLEPCDLFVDMGMLVVEGRMPGLTGRGYGEGPHCPRVGQQVKHCCDPLDPQCNRDEQFRKHMLLLWRNNIPMSIEVLLSPECTNNGSRTQGVESLNVPEPSYILLEQWTIHMLPKRVPDVMMAGKSLLHAVRSYLHFSQLSAWYSLSGGKIPQNVLYRICVPGEAFSNKFTRPPDNHMFPVANVGRNNAMKVSVKAMPRCPGIPTFLTRGRDKREASVKDSETNKMNMACALAPEDDFVVGSEDEKLPSDVQKPRRENSPDTLLGDSLLDPPQSLQMYPKRYQSPSRSGSPVMEAPEHLMCRPTNRDQQTDKMRMCGGYDGRCERSRPRRPFEKLARTRCLESQLTDIGMTGESLEKLLPSTSNSLLPDPKLSKPTSSSTSMCNTNGRCFVGFALTPKETEEVLNLLHQRNSGLVTGCKTRTKTSDDVYAWKPPCHVWNTQEIAPRVPSNDSVTKDEQSSNKASTRSSTLSRSDSPGKKVEVPVAETEQTSSSQCLGSLTQTPTNLEMNYRKKLACPPDKPKVNSSTSTSTSSSSGETSAILQTGYKKRTTELVETTKSLETDLELNNSELAIDSPRALRTSESSVEANKLPELTRNDDNNKLMTQILQKQLQMFKDNGYNCNNDTTGLNRIVPTANDKAKFRRSLDSATNMVFHCKTGLPLTSSPAPSRKGTCFDFDSSLTSVTAIKHALIEKNDNRVIEENHKQLSISAPALVTNNSLLGNFEESVLNGRLEPVSTVEGFTAEIGASGSFCPRHITVPVTVFFYTLSDTDKVSTPYLGHINLGPKGYHVPKKGTIQVTLFNPHGTVVKMFVVVYDLSDMPVNCQTFLRQRTLYMPVGSKDEDPEASKWLRYLVHLRFASSKSGRIYLHTDMRMVIFRKSDMDAATILGTYELRSFTKGPTNPKFSPIR